MRNARMDEAQAEIKIAGINNNNLRYADDTTRKRRRNKGPLDERGKWKSWFKTQHQKTKFMASGPITSWEIDGETIETVRYFVFFWAPKSLQMVTAVMKLKTLAPWKKSYT